MKRILSVFSICILVTAGCKKVSDTETVATPETTGPETVQLTHRTCAAQDVLLAQLAADPSLAARMQAIENVTANFVNDPSNNYLSNGIVTIPVVVNVLYNTSAQNISQAQIQSQIDVLNSDYSGTNSDISKIPSVFSGVKAGDTHIRFVLSQVVRKQTNKQALLLMML
jgi:hypothetical protein